jgi:hypothetical protein
VRVEHISMKINTPMPCGDTKIRRIYLGNSGAHHDLETIFARSHGEQDP